MSKIIKCVFSVTAAVLLALSAGCGKAADGGSGKIKVVCTVYPFYDWTVNIAGSSAEVDLIVSGGTDMHSYQPSAEDVIKIAGCDLLIYGGGASDSWVTEAVAQNENPGRTVINLLELLGSLAAKEEHTEGMQTDGHDHDGAEYDEHIWLSLKNAAFLTQKIAAALSEKDGENAGAYSANAEEYKKRLESLDKKYEETVSTAKNNTLVFADRFPFVYLTRDYGIKYYAAFPGCSAETEASFETVMFLSGKIDELGLEYIITTESPVAGIAETVRENTGDKNAEILALDSMQSLTAEDGQDYISVMEKNLEVLEKALD